MTRPRTARRPRLLRSRRRSPAPSRAPRITALRDRGSRVEVDLDGVAWRTLPVDAVVRCGLGVGRELDRSLARTLARELRRSGALHVAARVLRARDLSVATLQARLARSEVAPSAREEALRVLQEAGVVDDARFAARRAEALAERGYGDAAIRSDLDRQGVPPEIVAAALAALDPELGRAHAIVAERGRTPAAARFLVRRGFDPDTVADAVGPVVAGGD